MRFEKIQIFLQCYPSCGAKSVLNFGIIGGICAFKISGHERQRVEVDKPNDEQARVFVMAHYMRGENRIDHPQFERFALVAVDNVGRCERSNDELFAVFTSQGQWVLPLAREQRR